MIDATPLAALHEQVGNFLDEQRHAPSTLSHAVNHFFRQRILGGKLAHHVPNLLTVERHSRNCTVMRARPTAVETRAGWSRW
jgi:hypothetical protein